MFQKSVKPENSANSFIKELTGREEFINRNFHPTHRNQQKHQNYSPPSIEPTTRKPVNLSVGSINSNNKRQFPSTSSSSKFLRSEDTVDSKLNKIDLPKNNKTNTGFQLLPIPNPKPKSNGSNNNNTSVSKENVKTNEVKTYGRDNCLISGKVEFIMKMHKMYPEVSAFYEIYANILKISKGKLSCQHVILLRSTSGPVLQAVYYDFEKDKIDGLKVGQTVCCVGRLTSKKQFHVYKISKIAATTISEDVIARIQNVCSFTFNKNSKIPKM